VDFEWDDRKARENIAKHGVSFELATRAFEDPQLVLAEDMVHSRTETRYFAFGRVRGGVVTVRFTVRGERVRIIGAGFWRKGMVFYEQANRLHR
jgi:uncharacterized DUF497 family protein